MNFKFASHRGFVFMKKKFIFRNLIYFVILFIFLTNSCKVDEFKLNELGIKEGWSTEIVVPFFYGNMEFRDFITDWYNYEESYSFDEPLTILEYDEYYHKTIPTKLMFEPAVIIDSFPLLIQGNYELDSIDLEFIVTNTSPYPLNLELKFFNKLDEFPGGQPVNPGVFSAGNVNGNRVEPVQTVQHVKFSPEQNESFKDDNRVQFTSWYDKNDFSKDTLSANYPIEVSIILFGVIKNKNEN